ncbi:hypothetical protein [Chryseobacterium indoltheticum]|uniref:hypothetical protein n=1 Tax=Chryseobacterium indoltheticum TaxID=254 RepID=UPI003F490B81
MAGCYVTDLLFQKKYTEARSVIGNNTPNLIKKYIMGSQKNDFTAFWNRPDYYKKRKHS